MKDKLTAVITKIFGKTAADTEKLLKDNNGTTELSDDFDAIILSWNEEKMRAFKDRETAAHDKGYNKAKKEVLTDYEKPLKEAGYLQDGEQGAEALLTNIEAAITKQKGTSKMKDDDVKAHPMYLQLESDLKKKYISKEEHDSKVTELQKTITETERSTRVKTTLTEAMKYFNPEDYVLSGDNSRRANQIKIMHDQINQQFDDVEMVNGDIILLKSGKRLEDAHGNLIKLQDITTSIATSLFDKKAQGAAGSAGNNNNGQGGQSGTKYAFKAANRNELYRERQALQKEAKTPEEQAEIAKQALGYERDNKLQ